ncbi:MAG TPA: hypothetical protein VH120_12910 [Gemmataceae bacterium]|jgi:hypothetical protein|nr:hypothetical protein [Gemmataceae bacterium]
MVRFFDSRLVAASPAAAGKVVYVFLAFDAAGGGEPNFSDALFRAWRALSAFSTKSSSFASKAINNTAAGVVLSSREIPFRAHLVSSLGCKTIESLAGGD